MSGKAKLMGGKPITAEIATVSTSLEGDLFTQNLPNGL